MAVATVLHSFDIIPFPASAVMMLRTLGCRASGRIYENASVSAPPDMRWVWSVTAIVPATPGVTNGTAATRVEAMARFRAAWEKASRPSP
jgi:hypothetical protein